MRAATMGVLESERPIGLHRSAWLPVLVLLAGCAYATLLCSSGPDVGGHAVGTDDSYISYRYAKNWVDGYGLVFNQNERVEGFTNWLYVILMAIPFLLHVDVFYFSVVFNAVCAALAAGLLWAHLRTRFSRHLTLVGTLLFALAPSVWIWVSSGMETPLVLLLQVTTWVLVEDFSARPGSEARRVGALCVVLALLVLTRADGFVTGVLAAGFLLLRGQRRLCMILLATVGVTLGTLIAWRLAYYGEIWPNTYYVKVAARLPQRLVAALRQLGGVASRQGMMPYLVAASIALVWTWSTARVRWREVLNRLSFGLFFSFAWLGYWFYVGGDNFEDRFLLILIPIGIPLLLGLVQDAPTRTQVLALGLVALIQVVPIVRDERFGKHLRAKYDYRIAMGKYIGRNWPGKVLATGAAGKIPYFSGLKTIDMLGLTDRHIARVEAKVFIPGHSKEDPEYVLRRRPDVLAMSFWGDGLDIGPELSAERYRRAGYRIRAVANETQYSRGEADIIDVRGRSDQEIALLGHAGWRGVVLELDDGARHD